MKYFLQSVKYMMRNFIPLVMVAVLPAVILGLLVAPGGVPTFFVSYASGRGDLPQHFAGYLFNWRTLAAIALILVIMIVGASIIISAIEKHMRVGVMSVRSPIRLLNHSIIPVAITLVFWTLLLVVFRFLLFGLLLLVNLIFGNNWVLSFIIMFAVYVGLLVLYLFLSSPLLLWTPCMMIYGYKFGDAASSSFRMAGKRSRRLFVAQLMPLLIIFGAQIIIDLVFAPLSFPAAAPINIIMCLFLMMYFCSLSAVAYFDLAELGRKDEEVPLFPNL